ncbi:MAG: ATP-binding protein, partial [Thiotrichales bacterium]|nr:ATP-binding protein [Thiotrichales bacterium]
MISSIDSGQTVDLNAAEITASFSTTGFSFDDSFAQLLESRFVRLDEKALGAGKTAIITTVSSDPAGRLIWFIKRIPAREDAVQLITLAIDSSSLLQGTAVATRMNTDIYSVSSGLIGRQLLFRNSTTRAGEGWQISTFSDQSTVSLPFYSIRLDFSKPVYWHEIERGLIYTALFIGAGVTLLLVALVRARDMQARELRERNIVIEKQVEEQTKELAIARDKALEASRMKSDFLASMSHEIRTPLNAIIGMAELLSETTLNSEQKKYIDIFRKAGDTLLSLVNDILDLSKIEAQQLVLEEISFDLRETVEESVDIYAVKASEKNIELIARIMPGTPTRRLGDPTRLRQIILNLISNALKFTDQGEIIVTVGQDETQDNEGYLHFSVSDTGIGIPKDKLD